MSRKAPVINVMATAAAKGADPVLPSAPLAAPPSSPAPPPSSAPVPTTDAATFLSGLPPPSFELATIVRDPQAQPRVALNTETVDAYREVMAEAQGWGPFPAVVAFGPDQGRYYLADGFHRLAAAHAAGVQLGRVEVRPGGLREAILHSVGANAAHGLRRTNEDKRRAVFTLLGDEEWRKKSDHWIAERAAVSHVMVGKLRKELEATGNGFQSTERVGRDGRTLNTANIGRSQPIQEPTGNGFQSAEDSETSSDDSASEITPEAPSAVRTRRSARSLAALDGLLESLREAEVAATKLTAREVQGGLVAVLSWAAGGDGRKAKAFLRKLGIQPPKAM